MARKKAENALPVEETEGKVESQTNDTNLVETEQEDTTQTSVSPESITKPEDSESTKQESSAPSLNDKDMAVADEDIPDHAKRVLKIFSNLPEAYIDTTGGVYSPDSKPAIRGKAILYKNPFYHSKNSK